MNDEPVSYVTALDLADIMQDYAEAGFQYPLCMELKYVAVMLRQQQAEIEALKAKTLTDGEIAKEIYEMTSVSDKSEECIIVSYEALQSFANSLLRKEQKK